MLSDSEPDPLDKLETIIKTVGKTIDEKNENKRKAKLTGRKVCSTGNFKSSNNVLQDDFKKFDDSVQKYVNDVKSCTGLDNMGPKGDELPKSHMLLVKKLAESNYLKREDTFTVEDRKTLKKMRRKELTKKKNIIASCDSSDNDDLPCTFGHRTIITQVYSPEDFSNTKSNQAEPNKAAEDISVIDKAKEEELEKERQAKQEARKAAYKAWCDRKAEELKSRAEKQKKIKTELELKKEEALQRKKIQEVNFKSWLTRKKEEKKVNEIIEEMKKKEAMQKAEADKELIEKKVSATKMWKAKKQQEAKQKKEAELQESKSKILINELKSQKANEVFEEWIRSVHLKPKPSPLNKGHESYIVKNVGWINPIPWQSVSNDITSEEEYCY
ncbi:coiled-coil domain-containing protein 34-like [Ctenocephalides felis]|uniref:coiled-coil domain-containing protein 34-like n=1 Tax=Ctenocephalides felis TaxID=7515 RepID=UPI000E6E260E|nr:coiled-coil domain-containing protein 34-like [Ctenocephalides felis]